MVVKCRRASNMPKERESSESNDKSGNECCPIQNDFASICLLMFLYIMQGIPLGLAAAVPYILQSDIHTANYQTQATFSLALWPFSLKLLWAPLVDSIYNSRFGRRKSWLVPVQYAIGIDLLIMAARVDSWLGREPDNPWGALGVSNPVNIYSLTAAFFGLTLLAATQDIAVDGWALTMLTKRNISWASTCNSVGQVLGYVTAFVLFLCLESPSISNNFLRLTPVEGRGIVSFSGFLYFWGIAFLVTTTIVMILKHEENSTFTRPIQSCLTNTKHKLCPSRRGNRSQIKLQSGVKRSRASSAADMIRLDEEFETETSVLSPEDVDVTLSSSVDHNGGTVSQSIYSEHNHQMQERFEGSCNVIEVFPNERTDEGLEERHNENLSLVDTYRVMFGILRLKPVLQYIGIIFLVKGCLAAADGTTTLKLIERGVPKERLAFLSIVLLPVQAVLPLLVTTWSNGPRPLSVFSKLAPLRLILTASAIALVYYTPSFAEKVPLPAQNLTAANAGVPWNTTTVSYQTTFTWKFYGIVLAQMAIYSSLSNVMHVCQMAFQARISDPAVGGTYMTLLNTAVNLAGTVPGTLVLYLVDPLSIRHCARPDALKAGFHAWMKSTPDANDSAPDSAQLLRLGQSWIAKNATCQPSAGVLACEVAGGECVTTLDGFYLQVVLSILVGIVAFPLIVRRIARRLDALSPSAYTFRLSNSRFCDRKKRRR